MFKRILYIAAVLIALQGTALASGPDTPVVSRVYSVQDVLERFYEQVGNPDGSALTVKTGQVPAGVGSHIRIRYHSPSPILVFYAPLTFLGERPDMRILLSAVLPAATEAEVKLSLIDSPAWHHGVQNVAIKVFFLDKDAPTLKVDVVDVATWTERLRAYVRQFLQIEPFSIASTNALWGYSVGGASVTLMVGGLALLTSFLYAWRKKKSLLMGVFLMFPLWIALYQARFLFDVVRATAGDMQQWNAQHTVGQLGGLYSAADFLHTRETPNMVVATCGPFPVTPLRYLLFPVEVAGPEAWQRATHAVLVDEWTKNGNSFACGAAARPARVLFQAPDGTRVIEFLQAKP